MTHMDTEIVKILAIDTGSEPIKKERFDINAANPALVKNTVLSVLNRMGKNSHTLIHFHNKWFVCDHTAKRGPSSVYVKHEVHYHPFQEELT
jgi:hypothetical protein